VATETRTALGVVVETVRQLGHSAKNMPPVDCVGSRKSWLSASLSTVEGFGVNNTSWADRIAPHETSWYRETAAEELPSSSEGCQALPGVIAGVAEIQDRAWKIEALVIAELVVLNSGRQALQSCA